MNKEEILCEIEKTKAHLANMEKILEECESERWKPKDGEKFFFIDARNRVCDKNYKEINACCREYYSTFNCFKTEEEAKQEAEKILIRKQLEDIARRLNKGQEIDWYNEEQNKYFICSNHWQDTIILEHGWKNKFCGVIYCLDKNFLDVVIKEVGKERLKAYLRGE